MGTWGVAISSNDTYADIYGEFVDLYNEGLDVPEITLKLISENQEIVQETDEANNFWFAIGKAQWEYKQLDSQVLDQIKAIVYNGSDLKVWENLGASEKELKKRQEVLEKFLDTLLSERKKPKIRKKKVIIQPVFEKGDCLTFKLANGNYGGAVVLEAVYDTEFGHNLIALTELNCCEKPTPKDFEDAKVLTRHFGAYNHSPSIQWYSPVRHKNVVLLVSTLFTINVRFEYKMENTKYGYVGDFDIWLIDMANRLLITEQDKRSKSKSVTIKSLTKKSFWRL